MYQNVLFDLDDTLLDFQAGQQAGITKILQSQGVQDIERGLAASSRSISMFGSRLNRALIVSHCLINDLMIYLLSLTSRLTAWRCSNGMPNGGCQLSYDARRSCYLAAAI